MELMEIWEIVAVKIVKVTFLGAKHIYLSVRVTVCQEWASPWVLFIALGKKDSTIPCYVLRAQLKGVSLHYRARSLELNQEWTQFWRTSYKTEIITRRKLLSGRRDAQQLRMFLVPGEDLGLAANPYTAVQGSVWLQFQGT